VGGDDEGGGGGGIGDGCGGVALCENRGGYGSQAKPAAEWPIVVVG
jgi:hypothetical protein